MLAGNSGPQRAEPPTLAMLMGWGFDRYDLGMSRRSDTALAALEPWVPLVVGLVTLAVASALPHPVVFPDESAAITSANFLAGGGSQSEWWYLPGYSFLLAPVLALTTTVPGISFGVHVVNALLAATTSHGLVRIDRALSPDRSPARRAAAVLLVAFYPAYLYFSALAISDNLLVAGAVWAVVFVLQSVDRPQLRGLLLRTIAVSSLLIVHARALPILLAWLGVVAWMVVVDRRQRLAVVGVGVVSAVLFSVLGRALINYQRATGLADLTRQSPRELFVDLLGVRALLVLPFTALGQAMYLLMASLGLVAVGVVVLSTMSGSGNHREQVVGRFVLVALALSWALSSAFTNQGQGDLAMYGRYMEAVLAVPLFFGVVSMLDSGVPQWFRRWMPTAIILLACFVLGIRGYDAFNGRNQLLNVAGVAIGQRITGDLDPAVLGLFAGGATFVLSRARSSNATLGALVLLVVFAANTFAVVDRAAAFAATVDERIELLTEIERVDTEVCAGLDQAVLTDFATQELYRINNLDRDYVFVDTLDLEAGAAPPGCVGVIVSERADLASVLPGWRPVAAEPQRPQWLWVAPEHLNRFDQVLGASPGSAIEQPAALVEVAPLGGPEIDDENLFPVLVRLTNTSAEAFIPAGNLPDGVGGIRVGLEWRDPGEPLERIHEPIRVALPRILLPGESIVLEGEMTTTVPGFEAEPGTWVLRAEVVQEFVRWFDGDGFSETSVVVEGQRQ